MQPAGAVTWTLPVDAAAPTDAEPADRLKVQEGGFVPPEEVTVTLAGEELLVA